MRLIDADALLKVARPYDDHSSYVDTQSEVISKICDAPTVNAIPVEWILKWSAEHMEYGTLSVERMLEDWSRESSKNMAKDTN